MAYSTVADLKVYLGIPSGTIDDDVLLGSLLSQAQKIIENYTGNSFESVAETREFGRDCVFYNHAMGESYDYRDIEYGHEYGRILYLDDYLQSVTTLTNGDGVEIDAADYILLPKNRSAYNQIRLKSSAGGWTFEDGYDSFVTVEGDWGLFATAPDEIVWCTIRLAAYLYRQKDNNDDLDRSVVLANGVMLPSELPKDVMDILKNYRRTI